jgi:hypothetical protein
MTPTITKPFTKASGGVVMQEPNETINNEKTRKKTLLLMDRLLISKKNGDNAVDVGVVDDDDWSVEPNNPPIPQNKRLYSIAVLWSYGL